MHGQQCFTRGTKSPNGEKNGEKSNTAIVF